MLLLAASLGTARTAVADTPASDEVPVGHAESKGAPTPPKLTAEQERARAKLASTSPAVVRADLKPYLPLCDAAGYPVVGNAVGTSKAARMQPSEYCTLVRDETAKHVAKAPK